jgi:acyl carrier protein
MSTNHISERIHSFVLEKFPLARKRQIKSQDKLLESGIIDSLGILDLVAFVEENFGIVLSDDELTPENFQSIERLTAFVQSKIASPADARK